MGKYTKADFENARFAIHEAGVAVAVRWTAEEGELESLWTYERPTNPRFAKDANSREMAASDSWIPVKPARTASDSEVGEACEGYPDSYVSGYVAGFQAAGGTILDETDRERVVRLILSGVKRYGVDRDAITGIVEGLVALGLVKADA